MIEATVGVTDVAGAEKTQARRFIVDCDVHHQPPTHPNDGGPDGYLEGYLGKRWQDYLARFGMRSIAEGMQQVAHRAVGNGAVARLDTLPPSGLDPGADPDFAREQLLEGYGVDIGILNTFGGLGMAQGNIPAELGIELNRAYNDFTLDHWLGSDSRWLASICVPYESPAAAVKEIHRCRELDERFVQVLLPSRTLEPIGNPKYWPIFEAAVDLGIPVGFHVGFNRTTPLTACGSPSYYYEYHVDFALSPYGMVPSLIFEGVFERFPELRLVMIELGWAWAVPMGWRMDAIWKANRDEGINLSRKPSEILADRFWFTTQPSVQTTGDRWDVDLFEQFERLGGRDHLIYSSDYPHWDFDPPARALPAKLKPEARNRILSENAIKLYGLELDR
jgi:predicted TIM-barrel fold metal-dependent hydrolase